MQVLDICSGTVYYIVTLWWKLHQASFEVLFMFQVTEPYPTDTLDYIILAAASAIATNRSQQQSVNSAVQFLALLKSVTETPLSEG